MVEGDLLGSVAVLRDVATGRCSSYDRTGRNDDWWLIPPGESVTIADLPGPGRVTHLWFTQYARRVLGAGWEVADPDVLRTVLLRVTWDDQEHPAVLVPLGDFFCLGNGLAASFTSLPFTASANPDQEWRQGGGVALNAYLPMPFATRARLELLNLGTEPVVQYFHVDFELHRSFPEGAAYLHARWRRDTGEGAWGPDLEVNSPEALAASQLSSDGNVVILETDGDGQYVGCNLTVVHSRGPRRGNHPGEATWWGEGDDMIEIDGEPWPPRLHGTGGEDYFGHGWEMQRQAAPFSGSVVHEDDVPGVQVSYRFHLVDPIRFRRRIRVSMERGHANHLGDDWSATAYWYQALPTPPAELPQVDGLRPASTQPRMTVPTPRAAALSGLAADRLQARASRSSRLAAYIAERGARFEERWAATRAAEAASVAEVAALRGRFDGSASGTPTRPHTE